MHETQEIHQEEQEEMQVAELPKKPEKKFSTTIDIRKREKNPLLDREDVALIVSASITPSEQQAKQLLSTELKVPEELIVIRNIYSTFGKQEFRINAYLYNNKETLQKLVRKGKGKEQKEKNQENEKTEKKVTKEGKDEK